MKLIRALLDAAAEHEAEFGTAPTAYTLSLPAARQLLAELRQMPLGLMPPDDATALHNATFFNMTLKVVDLNHEPAADAA